MAVMVLVTMADSKYRCCSSAIGNSGLTTMVITIVNRDGDYNN